MTGDPEEHRETNSQNNHPAEESARLLLDSAR
jgi:hypothetical protein